MNAHAPLGTGQLTWPTDVTDIPNEVFTREDIFERELEEIFYGNYWQLVAHESEIPNPGDFKTFAIGRVPLLIARGQDGVVRVFINACSHRSTQVETATCGNRKMFECPYHRWTFKTDGSLLGAPAMSEFSPKFRKEDYGLKQLKTAMVHGVIFATMGDNPMDIHEFLGEVIDTIGKQVGHEGGIELVGYQKVRYDVNWKAYMDNDAYHPPLLHTGFRLLGWASGNGKRVHSPHCTGGVEAQLKPGKSTGSLSDPSLIDFKEGDWNTGSMVIAIFPLTVITKHLDIISIRFAMAPSHDVTEVHYAYFTKKTDTPELARHRVRQASNLVGPCGMISMEDAAIFNRVQIGAQAPGVAIYQKGVKSLTEFSQPSGQNDEVSNLARWNYYRKLMGFAQPGERL